MVNTTTILPGITLYDRALSDADTLLTALDAELTPTQEYLNFGRGPVPMPRLTAWHGDPGARYAYSGLKNEPAPWTPTLSALRARLDSRLGTSLNSCLVNVYADGRNSMGWHADDEPELRDRVVSVSLGATRSFQLREGRRGAPMAVALEHGSVLVMTIASQRHYQHAVPKEAATGRRINLTYRQVSLG